MPVTAVPRLVSDSPTNVFYAYGYTTLLNFLSVCYAARRGSIRYVLDASPAYSALGVPGFNASLSVSRSEITTPANVTSPYDNDRIDLVMLDNRNISGHNGMARTSLNVNPMLPFEIPYYSQYRFTPARQAPDFEETPADEPGYVIEAVLSSDVNTGALAQNFVCAGEDFQLYMWLGPPRFYREQFPPRPIVAAPT